MALIPKRPQGRFFLQVISAVSEFERELIRGRINDKVKVLKAQGKPLCRSKGSKDKKERKKGRHYLSVYSLPTAPGSGRHAKITNFYLLVVTEPKDLYTCFDCACTMDGMLRIGVVGYTDTKFDIEEARTTINAAYDALQCDYPGLGKVVVSGLTDLGISALAYREAVTRGWKTVGVACSKAFEHELFPVDQRIISGKEWGDESPVFLGSIDVLVRIGGGGQSRSETQAMKALGKPVLEYELHAAGDNQ